MWLAVLFSALAGQNLRDISNWNFLGTSVSSSAGRDSAAQYCGTHRWQPTAIHSGEILRWELLMEGLHRDRPWIVPQWGSRKMKFVLLWTHLWTIPRVERRIYSNSSHPWDQLRNKTSLLISNSMSVSGLWKDPQFCEWHFAFCPKEQQFPSANEDLPF